MQWPLVDWPPPNQMRTVTDRNPSLQMLVNRHHTASQAMVPARLGELKQASLQHDRVVLIDRALVLQTKHPVQIPPPAKHKGCTGLAGPNCKVLVELCQVALPQELIGLCQSLDLGAS